VMNVILVLNVQDERCWKLGENVDGLCLYCVGIAGD